MKLNLAERWAVNNPLRAVQLRVEIRWMEEKMDLRPGGVILEVGCGRGTGAALILREFQPAMLHAMDLDIHMIKKAKDYLSPEQRRRISLYIADVLKLPYRDEVLDAVFGFGVLHHVPDWQGSLSEISRVLKVGGFFCLEEIYPSLYQNFLTKKILLHPKEKRFSSQDLKGALEESKFSLQEFREVKSLGIFGFAVKGG